MKDSTASLRSGYASAKPTLRDMEPARVLEVIERLFARFADLYGARWTEAGNNRDAWARELADSTLDAIAFAVKQTEINHPEWPPTLLTFRDYSRGWVPPIQDRASLEQTIAQPQVGDSSVALRYRKLIRITLGMEPDTDGEWADFVASPENAANCRGAMRA